MVRIEQSDVRQEGPAKSAGPFFGAPAIGKKQQGQTFRLVASERIGTKVRQYTLYESRT
jgi:hypothetical protein